MNIPFDQQKLDRLMDQQNIDLILATSRHNVRYLLGGYEFFFFANGDAIGLGNYLPVVGYRKDQLEQAFYIGASNEFWQQYVTPVWMTNVSHVSWSSQDTVHEVVNYIRRFGLDRATIAIESAFLPADAWQIMNRELPSVKWLDATLLLEELRAVKSEQELAYIQAASEVIVQSFLHTFQQGRKEMTEFDLVEHVRRYQTNQGLKFDYCLITTGNRLERAPSGRYWRKGEMISLDSAGYKNGYLGDMARMGVYGEPSAQMKELLDEVETVQQAARTPISAGKIGSEIYQAAEDAMRKCPSFNQMQFVAHGMGLIPHEAPRLTSSGPIPYPGTHRDRPLEAGMVLSLETHIHSEIGFVKLEDTIVVTDKGWEAYADFGRGWNQVE
ncbi:Xaa-Pro aminopeptidase [Seinonella peptonophila]|uniref:Xaa-Pro aminopeptidase n=1 Tax=Seinonella peptonophila TaxID=112248 RepID=A0A1M4Y7P9_9BACL|nr:Xaa-Pro peptidase family protein [Seinonella peptonophila]SHF01636.1 Xaa-Pro aminopeptidase [Seinonella peptonophila]